jgi:hypothetical protein
MTGTFIVVAALIGLIPANIAHRKGASFIGWWIFGALLFIVALPSALMMRDQRIGECPWCKEDMRTDALVCPHCQRDVTPLDADGQPDHSARASI